MENGNERARTAMKMYSYRVKKYIGSYAAAMGGVDLIVFTGGIGENDTFTRGEICNGLEFLGVDFDFELNKKWRGTGVLSKTDSKVTTMVVETNEELVIALDTYTIVNSL
jgi:acetate kinase